MHFLAEGPFLPPALDFNYRDMRPSLPSYDTQLPLGVTPPVNTGGILISDISLARPEWVAHCDNMISAIIAALALGSDITLGQQGEEHQYYRTDEELFGSEKVRIHIIKLFLCWTLHRILASPSPTPQSSPSCSPARRGPPWRPWQVTWPWWWAATS